MNTKRISLSIRVRQLPYQLPHQLRRRAPRNFLRQSGTSLLEVLIAVLIMSFGLLALGGLTAASVQYGKMAQFQTLGVQLANDYTDRMRANWSGFSTNSYDKTSVYSSSGTLVTVPTCSIATACTPPEIAAIDKAEWVNSLKQRLPGGDAYVLHDVSNLLAVDVWIMWTEPNLNYGGDNSLSTGKTTDCPAAAITGISPVPRCMFFRMSI
jgi:type IV pilus assembly protein PilV